MLIRSYKSLSGQHRLHRSRHRANAHPPHNPQCAAEVTLAGGVPAICLHPPLLFMLLECTIPHAQVVSWAQQQFLQEVSREKPDSSINLAKVCLLLALEEEAAANLPDATQARCGRAVAVRQRACVGGVADLFGRTCAGHLPQLAPGA